jgi:hypothetical protein
MLAAAGPCTFIEFSPHLCELLLSFTRAKNYQGAMREMYLTLQSPFPYVLVKCKKEEKERGA